MATAFLVSEVREGSASCRASAPGAASACGASGAPCNFADLPAALGVVGAGAATASLADSSALDGCTPVPAQVAMPRMSWRICPMHDGASAPPIHSWAVTEQMRPVIIADDAFLWLHFFGLAAHATALISRAVSRGATDLRSVLLTGVCNIEELIDMPHEGCIGLAAAFSGIARLGLSAQLQLRLGAWAAHLAGEASAAPQPATEPDAEIHYYDAWAVLADSIPAMCRKVGLTQLTLALISFGQSVGASHASDLAELACGHSLKRLLGLDTNEAVVLFGAFRHWANVARFAARGSQADSVAQLLGFR